MADLASFARDLNTLGDWLAQRDLPELSARGARAACGDDRFDLLILFGGSIVYGIDEAARAWKSRLARRLMIVGGVGHTTQALRDAVSARYPDIATQGRAEADIIVDYLEKQHDIARGTAMVENRSANCGENAAFSRELALAKGLKLQTVLLMQDSTMQRRMMATLGKEWSALGTRFFSWAAYRAHVAVKDGRLVFDGDAIDGMWSVHRYATLLMGEIPRLRDDEDGYGPRGKGYLLHTDIPGRVEAAFARLQQAHPGLVRTQWDGEAAP